MRLVPELKPAGDTAVGAVIVNRAAVGRVGAEAFSPGEVAVFSPMLEMHSLIIIKGVVRPLARVDSQCLNVGIGVNVIRAAALAKRLVRKRLSIWPEAPGGMRLLTCM